MKKFNKWTLIMILMFVSAGYAQSRKDWGFGISLGDPTGFTAKYNVDRVNAWNFNIGSSYFGEIRLGADYLWHFNPFNSSIVGMHAGFGGVIGLGDSKSVIFSKGKDDFYVRDNEVGVGIRGIVGIDIYPNNSPFEIFIEMGPLIGLVPDPGGAFDAAIGFRFYP